MRKQEAIIFKNRIKLILLYQFYLGCGGKKGGCIQDFLTFLVKMKPLN